MMQDQRAGNPPPPRPGYVRFLLSHHLPEQYDRTLCLRLGTSQLRICTRCTGLIAGLLAGVALLPPVMHDQTIVQLPSVQLAIAILPSLAVFDWATQYAPVPRDSTTMRRLATGILPGLALWDLVSLVREGLWLEWEVGIVVMSAYLLFVSLLASRSILLDRA